MLLHLPIVLLATLSPIAVSDTVPRFDIVRECRFESLSTTDFDRCRQDEGTALRQLQQDWTRFVVADKSTCLTSTTIGGFTSYVELLTCLEMSRDASNADGNPRTPQTTEAMRLRTPGLTVGVGHDQTTPEQMPGRGSP
jgi:hypothetical protein